MTRSPNLTRQGPADPRAQESAPAALPDASPDGREAAAPVLSSSEVLRGHKAIAITHNGAQYRLQTTRQGKLILTK
jgi:hemin uptake protein HemP